MAQNTSCFVVCLKVGKQNYIFEVCTGSVIDCLMCLLLNDILLIIVNKMGCDHECWVWKNWK